jgi:hypothetical protein
MMQISLEKPSKAFDRGEMIRGRVEWNDLQPLKSLEIRLIWLTRGKGDRDVSIVQQRVFTAPAPSGRQDFEFAAPNAPYSFSGKLISLIWAIEVIAFPSGDAELTEIVIAPHAREVVAAS